MWRVAVKIIIIFNDTYIYIILCTFMSGLSDRELIQLFDGLSSNSSIKALGLGQLFTNVKPKYAVVLTSPCSLMVLFSSHVLGLE